MKAIKIKTKIRRFKYRVKHDYLTLNNVVMVVGAAIALSWAWGSINAMQKNYALQQELNLKQRDKLMAEIEFQTLEFEQKYLKSHEFQEIAARDKLGLADPGEHVLFLPESSSAQAEPALDDRSDDVPDSNFRQWANFLFGGNVVND